MARIRTVKPEFFRHEGLQDLEIANPGSYVMLVFAGLWGHCDKAGRFEWKPRMLKLDILPFLEFSMEKTLTLLVEAKMISRYSSEGKEYAVVESFEKHQRINGKEAQEPEKYPEPSEQNTGSTGEAIEKQPGSQEGKGREEEGNKDTDVSFVASESLTPCPHQEIIDAYAELLPDLPQPRIWDGTRQKNLANRWKWVLADLKKKDKPQTKAEALDFFRRMFAYISESNLLMGRSGAWSADLGWIVKAENFAKIIEGNYENKAAA